MRRRIGWPVSLQDQKRLHGKQVYRARQDRGEDTEEIRVVL